MYADLLYSKQQLSRNKKSKISKTENRELNYLCYFTEKQRYER